jgi:hypothetical protein
MKIHVHHEGAELGPLDVEEVRALLEEGKLSADTDAWVEGTEDWVPLAEILLLNKPSLGTQAGKSDGGHPVDPMASVKGDFKNLKANSAATAGELRQFLSEMRGQTPKEMLGSIAQSSLVRSVTLSAVAIFALLLAVSTIVYGVRVMNPEEPKKKETAETPANKPGPATNAIVAGTPPGTNDVLGINQSIKGKPKETNPFDTKGDLLDDIK